MKDVTFVTGNANKAKYFAELIGMPINHQSIDVDEIQSMDLYEVAEHKARAAYNTIRKPVLVEDQGMYLTALNGFPGPFVKFMIGDGKHVDVLINVLNGFEDRTAISKTVFVYFDGERSTAFRGELKGIISTEARGSGGFGWDPVFIPNGYGGRTRAELTKEEGRETYLIAKPLAAVGEFLRS